MARRARDDGRVEARRRPRGVSALAVAATLGLVGACAQSSRPSPPATAAPAPAPPQAAPPPVQGWPYWQAPALTLHPEDQASDLPETPPAWLTADPAWRASASVIAASARSGGVARLRGHGAEIGLGIFYEERARRGAPLLLTAESLFAVTHLAFASALADLAERRMRADLTTILSRLDARLAAEVTRARPDLLEGYRVARSTVCVALDLLDPKYAPPPELADVVAAEVKLVRAHGGLSRSPLFEAAIDYSAATPRGPIASAEDPRAATFRAAAWLAMAPFSFGGEGTGARGDVGVGRTQSRAALLLARLLMKDGDPAASTATTRMSLLDRFVLGSADDLSPSDVAEIAARSGIDLRGGADIASAPKLDRFRHAITAKTMGGEGLGTGRSMRLVPLRVPPDDHALEALVFPSVGARPGDVDAGPGGMPLERRTPSALDVAAWLGSSAAKATLRERGDFGYEGFDGELKTLIASRPSDEAALHASVYRSLLEALAAWVKPSHARATRPTTAADVEGKRRLRSALASWTFFRHDALAFAPDVARPFAPIARSSDADPGAPRVLVEPHPEAIASLLGAVRQLRSGLHELGALDDAAPSRAILDETESLLTLALDASTRAVNGDRSSSSLDPQLARLPSRIAAIEAVTHPAAEPVVVDVQVDTSSGKVLEEATGPLEEIFVWVVDPASRRKVLAVGPTIPQVEFVEARWHRLSDAAWAARIASGLAPAFTGE